MKSFVVLILTVLLVSLAAFPALAAEADPPTGQEPAEDLTPLPQEDLPPEEADDPPFETLPIQEDSYLSGIPEEIPSQDSVFHEAILSIFGRYTPKTQTVTKVLSDGSEVTYTEYVPGVAGMDFEWIFSAVLFALVIFCVFKMIGGLLNKL